MALIRRVVLLRWLALRLLLPLTFILGLGLFGLDALARSVLATQCWLLTVVVVRLHTEASVRRSLPQLLGVAHHVLLFRRNILV